MSTTSNEEKKLPPVRITLPAREPAKRGGSKKKESK